MNIFKRGVEALRQPDRNPRCYELTDVERLNKIREWSKNNMWKSTYTDKNKPKQEYYHE